MGNNGNDLWGPAHDLDFWTAIHCGLVQAAEARAMRLLSTVCDEDRFLLYCRTGRMPAMGNMTKRIYLVRRKGCVDELEDGRVVAGWCISVGPNAPVPGTDNVVAIKCLIEGEEVRFMRIGNRTQWRQIVGRLLDDGGFATYGDSTVSPVKSPYAVSFLQPSEKHPFLSGEDERFLKDPMYDERRLDAADSAQGFPRRKTELDMMHRICDAEDRAAMNAQRISEGLMPQRNRHADGVVQYIDSAVPPYRRAWITNAG